MVSDTTKRWERGGLLPLSEYLQKRIIHRVIKCEVPDDSVLKTRFSGVLSVLSMILVSKMLMVRNARSMVTSTELPSGLQI